MENELKEGGLARLKSGGPVVTIFSINGDLAYCRWIEEKHLHSALYPLASLEPMPLDTSRSTPGLSAGSSPSIVDTSRKDHR